MGKPVAELTREELAREKVRCETLLKVYETGPARKGLAKRLYEIEKRESRE